MWWVVYKYRFDTGVGVFERSKGIAVRLLLLKNLPSTYLSIRYSYSPACLGTTTNIYIRKHFLQQWMIDRGINIFF